MKEIRVLLVEDHFLARMALHSILSVHPQIRIIGEASDGEKGVALYRSLQPDVVVLDLRLPRLSGFEVIEQLRREFPKTRIVVLSNYQGSEDIYRALRKKQCGFMFHPYSIRWELVIGLRRPSTRCSADSCISKKEQSDSPANTPLQPGDAMYAGLSALSREKIRRLG